MKAPRRVLLIEVEANVFFPGNLFFHPNPERLSAACCLPYIVHIDPVEFVTQVTHCAERENFGQMQFASLLCYLCKLLIVVSVNSIDPE